MLILGRNSSAFWITDIPALRNWCLCCVADTAQLCNSLLNSQCCCCGLELRRGWRWSMTHLFVGGTEYCSPYVCLSVLNWVCQGWVNGGDLNLNTALVCSLQVSHLWLSWNSRSVSRLYSLAEMNTGSFWGGSVKQVWFFERAQVTVILSAGLDICPGFSWTSWPIFCVLAICRNIKSTVQLWSPLCH